MSKKVPLTLQGRPGELVLFRAFFQFDGDNSPLIDIEELSLTWEGMATLSGRSGVGKTTLFRLMAGWFIDESTKVIAYTPDLFPPRSVGFVGSHASLLPWFTVGRNIAFLTRRRIDYNVIEMLGTLKLLPVVLDKYPYQLSLGMYKRIELLIAVLRDPEMLLLDEFFSSIDDCTKHAVRNFIRERRHNRSTLVSAHEADLRKWISGTRFMIKLASNEKTIIGLDLE